MAWPGMTRSGWYRARRFQSRATRSLQYDTFWVALQDELGAPDPNLRRMRQLYLALRWLERHPGED